MHLGHVAGDESLQALGLGDQAAQLLLILGADVRLHRFGRSDGIPVSVDQRLFEVGEKLSYRVE